MLNPTNCLIAAYLLPLIAHGLHLGAIPPILTPDDDWQIVSAKTAPAAPPAGPAGPWAPICDVNSMSGEIHFRIETKQLGDEIHVLPSALHLRLVEMHAGLLFSLLLDNQHVQVPVAAPIAGAPVVVERPLTLHRGSALTIVKKVLPVAEVESGIWSDARLNEINAALREMKQAHYDKELAAPVDGWWINDEHEYVAALMPLRDYFLRIGPDLLKMDINPPRAPPYYYPTLLGSLFTRNRLSIVTRAFLDILIEASEGGKKAELVEYLRRSADPLTRKPFLEWVRNVEGDPPFFPPDASDAFERLLEAAK